MEKRGRGASVAGGEDVDEKMNWKRRRILIRYTWKICCILLLVKYQNVIKRKK